MTSSGLLISLAFLIRCCGGQTEGTEAVAETTTFEASESSIGETTTAAAEGKDGYLDMEIIGIRVLPKLGNAVELSWGTQLREYDLDWTYGVYYGLSEDEALKEPKLTTKELSAEVGNLTYCSQYIFAVGVVSANSKIAHPPRNIRTIGTLIDPLSPPENLQVDFLPAAHPCLLITWSASCPNIAVPVGYSVTVSERSPARMTIITEPRSASAELAQTLRVVHGKSYDIKVATDAVGAVSTATVPFTVPHFLQPYKVRLTSRPEGTFIVYWREPYVPYYVGDFYYEVYVYPGRSLASKPEIFPTTKPVFIHKGNLTEYTFMVGLRSEDGVFESHLTDPLVQNLDGQVSTLNIS